MARLEVALVGLFLACWSVEVLNLAGIVPLAGNFPLSLYRFYAVAAGLGWIFGNVYVHRAARVPGPLRRRVLVAYFVGPLGVVFLLRSMAPEAAQQAAPFVPYYAVGVFAALFLVPVVLRPGPPAPPARA